ncbi:MAG: hypothetical protein AMXMBFR61_02050 [Fimbriimonadales bacterium]
MAKVQPGDRVRIKERPATEQDVASMTYFPHYAGLEGEVTRVYDSGEAAVTIDPDCLQPAAAEMHRKVQQRVADKFLTGLSEEGRKRLTPEEKEIHLNYVVLVNSADLEPAKTAKAAAKPKVRAHEAEPDTAPKRPSAKDLNKAEEEYLATRKKPK